METNSLFGGDAKIQPQIDATRPLTEVRFLIAHADGQLPPLLPAPKHRSRFWRPPHCAPAANVVCTMSAGELNLLLHAEFAGQVPELPRFKCTVQLLAVEPTPHLRGEPRRHPQATRLAAGASADGSLSRQSLPAAERIKQWEWAGEIVTDLSDN